MFSFLIKYEINGANVNHPTSCISAVCFIAGETPPPPKKKVALKEEKITKEESKVTKLTTCYMYIQILLC